MLDWNLGVAELALVALIALIVLLVGWRIMWKCTAHGWLAVLLFVPVVNLLVLIYAAFCPRRCSPHCTAAAPRPPDTPHAQGGSPGRRCTPTLVASLPPPSPQPSRAAGVPA